MTCALAFGFGIFIGVFVGVYAEKRARDGNR